MNTTEKLTRLIMSEIVENIQKHYKRETIKSVAKMMNVAEMTLRGIKSKGTIGKPTLLTIAYFLWKESWPSPEQKKLIRDYIEETGGNVSVSQNTRDPIRTINEFITDYSDTEGVLEVIILLSSDFGMSEEQVENEEQEYLLNELIHLGFVEFHHELNAFKMNKRWEDEFIVSNSILKSLWNVALKRAETHFTNLFTIRNEIADFHFLKDDIEEIKDLWRDHWEKIEGFEKRARVKMGNSKANIAHYYCGYIMAPVSPKKTNKGKLLKLYKELKP